MIDAQGVKVFLGVAVSRVADLDWSRLALKIVIDNYYPGSAFGIGLTWRIGPGLALGFGFWDLWIGWPRPQESPHHEGCAHDHLGVDRD